MGENEQTLLGCVVCLVLEPDPAAGKVDEELRDALEIAILTRLAQLPMDTDVTRLSALTSEVRQRLDAVVAALKGGRRVDVVDAAKIDFEMLAVLMLPRAASPEGGLWAGFRYRLLKRDRFDYNAFVEEYKACSRRFARWTTH